MEDKKQQFVNIYIDNREQLKELQSITKMLPLTEKSTRKLELKNIDKLNDKRDFDLELEERQIYEQISNIKMKIDQLRSNLIIDQDVKIVVEQFKKNNTFVFDQLNKLEEALTIQIYNLTKDVQELNEKEKFGKSDDQISEIDEQQQQTQRVQYDHIEDQSEMQIQYRTSEEKTEMLLHKITQIDKKIQIMGGAKGKWLQSDHRDFLKFYLNSKGNETKFIKQSVSALAMTNIEILEHLEHYEQYLEYQKQKKIIAAEYKLIKQQRQKKSRDQKLQQQKRIKEIKLKKQQQQLIEREKRKKQIQIYKLKKTQIEMQEDSAKLLAIKQKNEAKQFKRTQSLAKNKKKLEEFKKYKAEQQKHLAELQTKLKAKKSLAPPLPRIK